MTTGAATSGTIVCHRREPSQPVGPSSCRALYELSLKHPKQEDLQACAVCERGKALFWNKGQDAGKIKEEAITMPDKKMCTNGDGKGAVKDGLCTRCYRAKHGRLPYPKPGDPDPKKPGKTPKAPKVPKASVKTKRWGPSVRKPARIKRNCVAANRTGLAAQTGPEMRIAVDFSGYPQAHAKLVDEARREHRTPELQMLHVLDQRYAVRDVMKTIKQKKSGAPRG